MVSSDLCILGGGGGFEDRNGEQCGYVYVNVHFGVEEGDGIENFTEIERQS